MIRFIFLLQAIINHIMRESRKQEPIDIKALFRNTKSKFYNKKQSFQKQDRFEEKNTGSNNSGAFWKEKGNQYFKNKQYDAAIQCYSKAIEINPSQSQYYSNRSKCYQKKQLYQEALKDAEVACELNQQNIKAHYTCGCILGQLGKNDDTKLKKAQNRIKKALRLCATLSTTEYQQQISIKIFRLRKIIFLKEQEKDQISLKIQKQIIKNAFEKYQIPKKQYDIIMQNLQKRQDALKSPKEIPDHLICKITLMLIQDPVVSEAGFSYQRKALQEYYQAKGPIEPITRKQTMGKIIANHSLKSAIEQFLHQNPWAYEQEPNQQYKKIIMI